MECTKKEEMNTKTMRLPPRRELTPNATNKRKEREGLDVLHLKPKLSKPATTPRPGSAEPISSNQILAGYLAHEFLTKGTLLGQPWDPAHQNEIVLPPPPPVSKKENEAEAKPSPSPSGGVEAERQVDDKKRYVEVANLLKTGGAYLPGIVNPTQLARFLQM